MLLLKADCRYQCTGLAAQVSCKSSNLLRGHHLTNQTGFKHWDFILLDSNKEPVARFHSNVWAYKKLGLVEFMGNYSAKTKEEICITGFTVYYNTLLRMNNLLQFFGAMGAKTGPLNANACGAEIPLQNNPAKQPAVEAQANVAPVESSKGTTIP